MSTPRLTLAAGRPDFHGRAFWEAVATQGVELEIVALTEPDTRSVWRETAENVRELHVPLRMAHAVMLERWLERRGATEVLALGLLFRHTPEFGEALWSSARGAAAVVAAGAFAGPALLLHTGAALVVDAEDVSVEPSPNSVPLIGAAFDTERRVSRAAALIRCHSERQADALRDRHGLDRRRLIIIADGGDEPRFAPFDVRRARAIRMGIDARPVVLAPALGRSHSDEVSAALDRLAAELPDVRVIQWAAAAELDALLTVASCAVVLDDGPGARTDIVTLAQAGVPLLSEPGALADAGLRPGADALVIADRSELASTVLGALRADHTARVASARVTAAGRSHAMAAAAFVADARVQILLEWGIPMRRRPRHRSLIHA